MAKKTIGSDEVNFSKTKIVFVDFQLEQDMGENTDVATWENEISTLLKQIGSPKSFGIINSYYSDDENTNFPVSVKLLFLANRTLLKMANVLIDHKKNDLLLKTMMPYSNKDSFIEDETQKTEDELNQFFKDAGKDARNIPTDLYDSCAKVISTEKHFKYALNELSRPANPCLAQGVMTQEILISGANNNILKNLSLKDYMVK